WVIGWSIAAPEVARTIAALQSHTTSNAAAVAQHAALVALTQRADADAAIATMVGEFRRRRDAATALLRAAGADFVEPRGAFYLFVRVPPAGAAASAGSQFAQRLLEESNVAVVPGDAFHTP